MTLMLAKDDKMLERMEEDLRLKAVAILTEKNITAVSKGVYSLDDLDALTKETMDSQIAIGAGYEYAAPLEIDFNAKASATPGLSGGSRMTGYYFTIIIAVPVGECCGVRYNAMELLTALRLGIHGSQVSDDKAARGWGFQKEKAEHQASTTTLLYYSQTWMVALPLTTRV